MEKTFFADVFQVNSDSIPPLFIYTITTETDEASSIGGKLAYRLKNKFGGNWIWCNGKIISDKNIPDNDLTCYLKELWETVESEDPLKKIQSINTQKSWSPLAFEIGDFAARGLMANYHTEIRNILDQKKKNFGNIRIDCDYSLRGWVVGDAPAISISISFNITHTQNLAEYAAGIKDPQELLGMMVSVDGKNFKGEICEITGRLSQLREWLLSKSTDEITRSRIQKVPDDELTVKIATRTSQYIYIASMLRPVVRMGDLQRFGVKPPQVVSALRLAPKDRASLIQSIAAIGKKQNIIDDNYYSTTAPQVFLTAEKIKFTPKLKVGNNHIHEGDQRIYQSLQKHGLFSRSPAFPDINHPIKIGIINALPDKSKKNLICFLQKLKDAIEKLGFSIISVKVEKNSQQRITCLNRASLETAINQFDPEKTDILLVLFPGDAEQELTENDTDTGMYHVLKSLTMKVGLPSQVVYEDTFDNIYALDNIVLGILAKTRNIPFVLGEPVSYTDMIVGIDIARRQKKKLAGSVNATATARIYCNDGQFLRYVIHDAQLDGETIPPEVLKSLFPLKDFQGKRVIIHRDGFFRGNEKEVLHNWASEIKATFMLVEVIKSGAPRIYLQTTNNIDMPPKGTAFKLNDNEAFLVSSPPPFKGSTPRPLHIRTDGNFLIETAIHSVLSLTLLHYGSVREPRLPVSIHYSDKIAEFSLAGIKPKDLEGDIPYWL